MEFIEELRSLKEQVKFEAKFDVGNDFQKVVIAGMGGSGIVGRIFQELYSDKPVYLVNDYNIPNFVGRDTLFIAVSYSGNTEETLSATRSAIKKRARVVAITSGGELAQIVDEKAIVPKGLQPRSGLGYMLMPIINTLAPQKRSTIEKTYMLLDRMDKDNTEMRAMAERINKSKGIPVIYGYFPFGAVAYRWKTQFNENAKVLAHSSSFPELNHNETMPLSDTYRKGEFFVIAFANTNDSRIAKRILWTQRLTKSRFELVKPKGTSTFERLFYLIHYGDYVSHHLSLLRKVDPTDISLIEQLKRSVSK